jgi:hypothetical protein
LRLSPSPARRVAATCDQRASGVPVVPLVSTSSRAWAQVLRRVPRCRACDSVPRWHAAGVEQRRPRRGSCAFATANVAVGDDGCQLESPGRRGHLRRPHRPGSARTRRCPRRAGAESGRVGGESYA